MTDFLQQLKHRLPLLASQERDRLPAGGLSIFTCYRAQEVTDMPMMRPCVMAVVTGRKEVATASRTVAAGEGEMILLPGGNRIWLGNYPSDRDSLYCGLGLRFSGAALEHFRQVYGKRLSGRALSPVWHARIPAVVQRALLQWLELGPKESRDPELDEHRQVEMLLLLAQAGLAGNLLLDDHPSWRLRVSQFMAIDPARPWQMREVCRHFGVSETSLRRHLREEATSFREVLEELRLGFGLSLILETSWSIGRIAEAVGYQSQSRFGERFKQRFGTTPSALRRTQSVVSGEKLASGGE